MDESCMRRGRQVVSLGTGKWTAATICAKIERYRRQNTTIQVIISSKKTQKKGRRGTSRSLPVRRNELEHLIPGHPVQQRLVEPRCGPITAAAAARASLKPARVVGLPLLVWDRPERPDSIKGMSHVMEESREPDQRPRGRTTTSPLPCQRERARRDALDAGHAAVADFKLSHRVFDPAVVALRRIHPRLHQRRQETNPPQKIIIIEYRRRIWVSRCGIISSKK